MMKLRGWSYFHLRRNEEAERIFEAVAATGDNDAIQALNFVRAELEPHPLTHNGF